MKILALLATPHGLKGNTAALLREVLAAAEARGAATETIVLPGQTVQPCAACDTCHVKGVCPQKDDFEAIKQKIMESDGLVLASPNYMFNVSAQMKAFMDRCCGVVHLMRFEGKYGASVVTSGGGGEEPIATAMNHFLITTGIRPVGAVWCAMAAMRGGGFPDAVREAAADVGEKLVEAIENKPLDPATETELERFRGHMRRLIAWRGKEWPYEHEYWKERGWL